MQKINDEMLAGVVSRELSSTNAFADSDLATEQARNLDYYYGNPRGDEKQGFSQVVTRDVLETVEGIMPELMKIFTSGDNVVQFEPVSQEDSDRATQETDYINYIFLNRMGGFTVLYNWMKDALLMKNGIIKVSWAEEDKVEFHTFNNLTNDQIDLFEDDEEVESVEIVEDNEDGTFNIKLAE